MESVYTVFWLLAELAAERAKLALLLGCRYEEVDREVARVLEQLAAECS